MKSSRTKLSLLSLGLMVQLSSSTLTGCSKKKSSSTDSATTATDAPVASTPGVTASDSNELALSGQLALTAMGLVDSVKGVLSYTMMRGSPSGDPQKIDVDADGNFSLTVARADEAVQVLIDEMAKSRDARDWAAMLEAAGKVTDVGGLTVDQLKSMSEDELNSGIADLAAGLKKAGAMTLLVAYDVSGDLEAEASSFRFINLPTASGKGLSALPNKDLIGAVNFGKITGTDADVKSEVAAGDALSLSSEAIDSLADASRALKAVKNNYMNDGWKVQPFYYWKSNVAHADVIGAFSDVSKNTYHGYGFYVGSNGDQGLTYDKVCGAAALTFTPPSSINEKDDQDNVKAVAEYSNAGATKTTQGDSKICYANGYYAREDYRDGKYSYMLNFGTGGSIQDAPEGLWRMKIDGTEVGRFDLSLAAPIVDGKPTVFLPQVKFNKTGSQITSVEVELYRWNGSAYEKMTDLAPVTKLVSEFAASITRTSDNADLRTMLTVNDDGTITGKFDSSSSSGGSVENPPVDVSDISSFAVYYNIGDASYRMEFR